MTFRFPDERNSAEATSGQHAISVNFLADLGVEAWRVTKRLRRLEGLVGQEVASPLRDAVERLNDTLERYELFVRDHDGEKYDEGLALEILHADGAGEMQVEETITPTVKFRDLRLVTGKVILGVRGGQQQ